MNLGVADYDGLQTQVSYRGNSKMLRRGQLHAVEGDQHHRAGRQRHRAEREQHRAARRRRARTEPARSAPSRGDHVQLPAAVQHHGRHRDAARVGASVQRRPPASTTTATARTTTARSSTARSSASRRSAAPARRTCRCSSRAASSSARPHDPAAAGGLQPLQPRQHPRPRADDLRRHRRRRTRRSASSSPSARRPTRIPAFANIDPPRMFQFQVRFSF